MEKVGLITSQSMDIIKKEDTDKRRNFNYFIKEGNSHKSSKFILGHFEDCSSINDNNQGYGKGNKSRF